MKNTILLFGLALAILAPQTNFAQSEKKNDKSDRFLSSRDVNDDIYNDTDNSLKISSRNQNRNNAAAYGADEYAIDEPNYTANIRRFNNQNSGLGYYSPYYYGNGWNDPWFYGSAGSAWGWNSYNSGWGYNNGWNNCWSCNSWNNPYNNGWNNNGWGYNNGWNNNGWGYNNGWNNNGWGYNNGWNNNNNWNNQTVAYDPSNNGRPQSRTRYERGSDGNMNGDRTTYNRDLYSRDNSNSNSGSGAFGNPSNNSSSNSGSNSSGGYNRSQSSGFGSSSSGSGRSTGSRSSGGGSFNTHNPSNNTSSTRRSGR